jgi:hypothetical protein
MFISRRSSLLLFVAPVVLLLVMVKEKSKKSQRKDSFSVPGYPPIPKRLKNQLAFRMGCK